jgi:hypothetical protein
MIQLSLETFMNFKKLFFTLMTIFLLPAYAYSFDSKSHDRFVEILNQVTPLYDQQIESMGVKFKVLYEWLGTTENARAVKDYNNWSIFFDGSLYVNDNITNDAFALAVCHEIGHLIGGAPFINGERYSVEGQADFWAAAVCLRKYFKSYPTITTPTKPAQLKCDSEYGPSGEREICYRSIAAAEALSLFFARATPIKPNLNSTDQHISSNTAYKHPAPQCRLDTYVAASLCTPVAGSQDDLLFFKKRLTTDFLCKGKEVEKIEKRPSCWFNSKTNQLISYAPKYVKSKKIFSGVQGGKIDFSYANHLPGTYRLTLSPTEESKDLVEIETDTINTEISAGSSMDASFKYKFKNKVKGEVSFNMEIEYNGEVVYTEVIKMSAY